MVDVLVSMAASSISIADLPDLIQKAFAGQQAIKEALSAKDRVKMDRLNDILSQLQSSIHYLQTKTISSSDVKALNESIQQIQTLLSDFQAFCSQSSKSRAILSNSSNYLDQLTQDLFSALKLFRFAISLSGYVNFQKNNSLAKLIADPKACDQWIQSFGTSSSSAPFNQVLLFLDKYFSENGELEASCNSESFFSWYRHEGNWSKCALCKKNLVSKLVSSEDEKFSSSLDDAEVKLHSFAKFCGENLVFSIRDLILASHPWNSSSRFQLINPALHIAVDQDEDARRDVSSEKVRQALEHNQICFVGSSDHLAELHHSVCRQVLHKSVERIDSVKDVNQFKEWFAENESAIHEQKGKIMVVVDCQFVHEDGGRKSSGNCCHVDLVAEQVLRLLKMKKAYAIGVALLTCPFLIHDASKIEQLQDKFETTPFERRLISSDFRKMSQFIGTTFAVHENGSFVVGEKSSAGSNFNEDLSAAKNKFAAQAGKYKKAKKSKMEETEG